MIELVIFLAGMLIGYWIAVWDVNRTLDSEIDRRLREAGLK